MCSGGSSPDVDTRRKIINYPLPGGATDPFVILHSSTLAPHQASRSSRAEFDAMSAGRAAGAGGKRDPNFSFLVQRFSRAVSLWRQFLLCQRLADFTLSILLYTDRVNGQSDGEGSPNQKTEKNFALKNSAAHVEREPRQHQSE